MNAALDNELIMLIVNEYESDVYGAVPDLIDACEDDGPESIADAVEDFAAQRIHDGETITHYGNPQPEHRAAARLISERISGVRRC